MRLGLVRLNIDVVSPFKLVSREKIAYYTAALDGIHAIIDFNGFGDREKSTE